MYSDIRNYLEGKILFFNLYSRTLYYRLLGTVLSLRASHSPINNLLFVEVSQKLHIIVNIVSIHRIEPVPVSYNNP